MPPSSLIFAVIVAVWAAYVVQHWIHRREHVATARSVDRFSEAMRVLERRQRRPQVNLSEPTPRSYAVSVMRPAAPDVVVKRAQPSAPTSPTMSAPPAPQRPAAVSRRPVADRPLAVAPGVNATRMRGIALLTAGAVFVVTFLGAATGVLSWWAVTLSVGLGVLALVMVRRSVGGASARPTVSMGSMRARTVAPVPAGRGSRRSMATAGGSAAAAFASNLHGEQLTSATAVSNVQQPAADDVVASGASRSVVAGSSGSQGVYDIDAVEQLAAEVPQSDVDDAPKVVEPLEPGTWAPVPVPPPTYTLKAKARPRPVHTELPVGMPQDGTTLSLEEEFEELPPAIRGLA